jgi:glycosyltransferase involved in cell wall biosynthesis
MAHRRISLAVFAYNEGKLIERAINSVLEGLQPGYEIDIRVLVNGATDDTLAIARAFAQRDARVHAIDICVGDKCNAWNVMVHELAPEADAHVFMDGDCWASPNAVEHIVSRLRETGTCGVAGLPLSVKAGSALDMNVRQDGWVLGPLYAVSAGHMAHLRAQDIRLPIGLFGNDHMITRFLRADGEFLNESPDHVTVCEGAGFHWDRVSPFRYSQLRAYFKQQRRYRLRTFQLERLEEFALRTLPATMDDINLAVLDDIKNKRGLVVRPERKTSRSPAQHTVYDRWVGAFLANLYKADSGRYFESLLRKSSWTESTNL